MKTILYATDYSENSVPALHYAEKLSSTLKTGLIVLHVFDYPTVFDTAVKEPFPNLEEDAHAEHRSKLREFCREHMEDDSTARIMTAEHKNVRTAIAGKARETEASLLVVGMTGGSALREVLMGNTSRKLISEAPCPVLCIPADASFNGLKRIVYATDFEEEDIGILKFLSELAEPFGAIITALHLSNEKEYAGLQRREWFQQKLSDEIDYPNVHFEEQFSETPFETLRVYLGDYNADLVVMLERSGKPVLERIFHRDMVKQMQSYGRMPLLAFHEKNF